MATAQKRGKVAAAVVQTLELELLVAVAVTAAYPEEVAVVAEAQRGLVLPEALAATALLAA